MALRLITATGVCALIMICSLPPLEADAASREQQMAELNGNLPLLSSLAQSGSTRAGSDLARAFYSTTAHADHQSSGGGIIGSAISSNHDNGFPVATSSKDVLPAVVTEPNEAAYSVAAALASDLPGLQEQARLAGLAQEARLHSYPMHPDPSPTSAGGLGSYPHHGADALMRVHDAVFHAGSLDAMRVSKGRKVGGQGTTSVANKRPDSETMAAVHSAVRGKSPEPHLPVMPKLASTDHLGVQRSMSGEQSSWEDARVHLQAANVAGIAGFAARRLLQA